MNDGFWDSDEDDTEDIASGLAAILGPRGSSMPPDLLERHVTGLLGRLSPAQDALGTHIDLLVGLEKARATAEAGEAEAWFNVGWLTAQLDASADRCARALERAAKSDPFWRD